MAKRRAIRCAGCGILAPPDVDVASGPDFKAGDVIEWLCDHCRAAAAAMRQPVPHYTTLAEIGRDATGVVYKALHRQSGRIVALKLIVPERAGKRPNTVLNIVDLPAPFGPMTVVMAPRRMWALKPLRIVILP